MEMRRIIGLLLVIFGGLLTFAILVGVMSSKELPFMVLVIALFGIWLIKIGLEKIKNKKIDLSFLLVNDKPSSVTSQEESLMSGKNWLSNLLDKLEDLEVKMIYGVFQFIFWKVPKFIKDTLINWFPTLVKLIKVIFLFLVWLAIISSPLIYFVYTNYDSEQISESFARFSDSEYLIVTFWIVIGLIGSIWGIFHLHRKQYDWFKSIKSFVLHRNK